MNSEILSEDQPFPESPQEEELRKDDEFFPKGAIAFFLLFMILMVMIWGFIYLIMIYRGS